MNQTQENTRIQPHRRRLTPSRQITTRLAAINTVHAPNAYCQPADSGSPVPGRLNTHSVMK